MTIHYSLFPNKLQPGNPFFAAKVNSLGTIGLNELADQIVARGTTVTKTDVLAVLETACQCIETDLIQGFRVSMGGVVDIFTSIKGKFTDSGDAFDPARHEVDIGTNPGARIRNNVRDNTTVEKNEAVTPKPNPENYIDMGTGTMNEELTPGSIGTINGARLSYDETNPVEGIFFISSGGTPTKVTGVQKNKPGELVFLVPNLTSDNYTLEVRAMFTTTGNPRVGTLSNTLEVMIPPVASSKSNGGKKRKASVSTTTNSRKQPRTASNSTSTSSRPKKRRTLAKV